MNKDVSCEKLANWESITAADGVDHPVQMLLALAVADEVAEVALGVVISFGNQQGKTQLVPPHPPPQTKVPQLGIESDSMGYTMFRVPVFFDFAAADS